MRVERPGSWLPAWPALRGSPVSAPLPPGAAVRTINDFGYYAGSHVGLPLAVLAGWALVGLGLILLRQRVLARRLTQNRAVEAGERAMAPVSGEPKLPNPPVQRVMTMPMPGGRLMRRSRESAPPRRAET